MAPVKPAVPSFARDLDSLESPVSLLWAHQLRREHSLLLTRLDELAKAVGNVSVSQLDEIAAKAALATEAANNVKAEQTRTNRALELAKVQSKQIEKKISKLSEETVTSDKSLQRLRDEFGAVEDRAREAVQGKLSQLQQEITQRDVTKTTKIDQLAAQVDFLETKLSELVEDVTRVPDSVEGIRNQKQRISILSESLLQKKSDVQEDMLTLNPHHFPSTNVSYLSDIDLDENMPALNAAPEIHQAVKYGDSMAMLLQVPATENSKREDLSTLKQRKFQTWDHYLATGEPFAVAFLKREEFRVVEAFVAGIHDDEERARCEKYLDGTHWTWDNVKSFATKLAGAEEQTQRLRPRRTLPARGYRKEEEHTEATIEGKTRAPKVEGQYPRAQWIPKAPQPQGQKRRSPRNHEGKGTRLKPVAAVRQIDVGAKSGGKGNRDVESKKVKGSTERSKIKNRALPMETVPMIETRNDPITPKNKTIASKEAEEPARKKRKVKELPLLPKIKILPLTDEED